MFKRMMSCLIAAVLVCCAIPFVSADTPLCTLRVTLPGGNLTLYRVGEVLPDGAFRWENEFAGQSDEVNDLQSPTLAAALAEYALTHSCAGITKTLTAEGTLVFSDLQPGLYLLIQTEAAEGYAKISPFLAALPGEENGKTVYETDATPKINLTPAPTEPEPTDPSLPQTGQLKWPVPLLTLSGLALLAVGVYLLRRRNHG